MAVLILDSGEPLVREPQAQTATNLVSVHVQVLTEVVEGKRPIEIAPHKEVGVRVLEQHLPVGIALVPVELEVAHRVGDHRHRELLLRRAVVTFVLLLELEQPSVAKLE